MIFRRTITAGLIWLALCLPAFAALQYSVAVNNARLDAIETTISTSAVLKILTGAVPANCAAADGGTILATMSLQADWMAGASGASKAKSGTWSDSSADASGTAAHFRLFASDGTTCGIQGTVGTVGTDIVLDSVSVTAGQTITINTFTLTTGNQ